MRLQGRRPGVTKPIYLGHQAEGFLKVLAKGVLAEACLS